MKFAPPMADPKSRATRSPVILVRSSWQSVNIGDISHTPGLLRLLEKYLPEAEVILWACNLEHGAEAMLRRDFPEVRIFDEAGNHEGAPESPEGRKAWDRADFLLHGSGPYVVARKSLSAWARTQRPYGVYGVTLETFEEPLVELLTGADFVFCRDTESLRISWAAGVRSQYLEFAPDAAFAAEDCDEVAADTYLSQNNLRPQEFICAISRLRYTPYFEIQNRPPRDQEASKAQISQHHKEADHERLRRTIISWVRATGKKVLVCPEMTYEIELTKEQLVDRMPDDVRDQVIWRDTYWTPDEAAGVFARSFAVVSMEMHSPIIACAVNTPAFYLRLPTDTCKGQMWRDIGLPEWIFEVEESDGDDIGEALLMLWRDRDRTKQKLAHARQRVAHLQEHSMEVVRCSILQSCVVQEPLMSVAA